MTRTRKLSTSEKVFKDYKLYIVKQLLEFQHALSYATVKDLSDWQSTLSYDNSTMESIMRASITFISTLDDNESHNTSPTFLQALTAKIANYLTTYKTKDNPRVKSGEQMSAKSLNKIRAKVREELQTQLYNCNYIKSLLARQAAKRRARANGWRQGTKQIKKRERAETARREYELKRQVRGEFIAAQNMPGFKR